MKIDAPKNESSVPVQKRVAESEINRLKQLKHDFLEADDDQEREETMVGLGAPTAEILAMRRYEAVCLKRFDAALAWLDKSRKHRGLPSSTVNPAAPHLDHMRTEMAPKEAKLATVEPKKIDPSVLETAQRVEEEPITPGTALLDYGSISPPRQTTSAKPVIDERAGGPSVPTPRRSFAS